MPANPTRPHPQHTNDEQQSVGEVVEKAVKSEDRPLGEQVPGADFLVVAMSYLAVGFLVVMVIAATIFLT